MPLLSDAALDDLRDRNPVAEIVHRLGVTLRRSGHSLMGPCPICGGGKSAQRFEVKPTGRWACAVCQDGGDVIRLVQKAQGLDFRGAIDWLGGAAEPDPANAARRARERLDAEAKREIAEAREREAERTRLYALYNTATREGGDVAAYLAARGLSPAPRAARERAAMPYHHGRAVDGGGREMPRAIHTGPAMVLPILRPDGVFGGAHVTWINPAEPGRKATIVDPDSGRALPAKKVRGVKAGGRVELVRLAAPRRLILGEGIETVLSAWVIERYADRLDGTAFWSSVDLGNLGGPATSTIEHPTARNDQGRPRRVPSEEPDPTLPAIPVPESVTELILLGDGDSDRFDTETALRRAVRRYSQPNRTIRIAWAPQGQDFNDLIQH